MDQSNATAPQISGSTSNKFGPPSYENGFAPPSYDNSFAPPSNGNGFAPPSYENGFAPPSYENGFAPPSYENGFAPPSYGIGSAPPSHENASAPTEIYDGRERYRKINEGRSYQERTMQVGNAIYIDVAINCIEGFCEDCQKRVSTGLSYR